MIEIEGNATANQAVWTRVFQTVLSKLAIVHWRYFISRVDSLVHSLMSLFIHSINSSSMEREVSHVRVCVCVYVCVSEGSWLLFK